MRSALVSNPSARALEFRRTPFVLGLTGSIGMGKSTVAAMFEGQGVPVFDADAAVRALQAASGRLVKPIERAFPNTTGPRGVDRDKLGAVVLGNPAAMRILEAIVHPAVAAEQRAFLKANRARNLVVLDIPLLLEKGGWQRVDAILVVSAPLWMQRQRVMARPRMSAAKYRHFIALQMSDSLKRRRAHWVLDTGGAKEKTNAAVRHLVSCILASKA
jgi:dephospho-CoA kinase